VSSPSLEGAPVVCVGFADWDAELRTNQHHLMTRVSAQTPVLFVESLGLRRPTASARDVRRMARRLRRGLRPLRRTGSVAVLSPLVVPLHGSRVLRRVNAFLLRRTVARAMRTLGFDRPTLWAYVPQAAQLIAPLRPRFVVYHCVDNIGAHDRIDSASFDAAESMLVAKADLVIASSEPIRDRLRATRPDVELMPNVADTELFSTALTTTQRDPALEALPRPRIVFVGAVDAIKIDLDLLGQLADLRPDWSFVLVGPVGIGDPDTDVSALAARSNVHLVGARPQPQLPAVLAAADVGIIPYRINDLTSGIFPMKVYEYLSAGLPTIATPLPSLHGTQDIVVAGDAASTSAAIADAIAQDSDERRRARSSRAARHSWEERMQELERAMGERTWRP
jgi:glycosyltransferase involved in cell wall biosynthesis